MRLSFSPRRGNFLVLDNRVIEPDVFYPLLDFPGYRVRVTSLSSMYVIRIHDATGNVVQNHVLDWSRRCYELNPHRQIDPIADVLRKRLIIKPDVHVFRDDEPGCTCRHKPFAERLIAAQTLPTRSVKSGDGWAIVYYHGNPPDIDYILLGHDPSIMSFLRELATLGYAGVRVLPA